MIFYSLIKSIQYDENERNKFVFSLTINFKKKPKTGRF